MAKLRIAIVLLLLIILSGLAISQDGLKARTTTATDWQEVVTKEFGENFKVSDAVPPMVGDLDGDGLEDAVLIGTGSAPLVGQEAFHFKVLDPYNGYFGFGDPKVTTRFGASGAGPLQYILIIHAWKSEAPKGKFMIINVPFEKIKLTQGSLKKKKVSVIETHDSSGLTAIVFWDGKKYRWEPNELE